ncbi:ycf66 family protein [Leptolyngbya sp. Heron Island J]|uniref:Ycf66 family protein n=1 Tax=Leptolyngbya sp. Heron Island J TaxID=1385935 RepID=UPI0003B9A86F|nr:Ycf66 family protein [Leptolyngbya sp. Heron Island J]ESA34477.1 ycf66 family protein [Leptolyngbya sp. Heron Island J]
MLANLLAVIVGVGSLAFYLAAFILPEVHRRSDFFWSGVGMFYAVVLWYCARQMNGAVLLGQTASVGLLLWLGYQTLRLRRMTTPAAQQTPIQLGKSERTRLNGAASRPLTKDYEFVEDGVEDTIDQDLDPDAPILIKPAADEFALKMVVPAAMAKSSPKAVETPEQPPTTDKGPAPKRKKPNPLEAVGIFAGWLKDIVTSKKPAPKPMIELPPRPPSIPKPVANAETTPPSAQVTPPADDKSSAKDIPSPAAERSAEPDVPATVPEPEAEPATPPTLEDDEDSNWPDDEFWD